MPTVHRYYCILVCLYEFIATPPEHLKFVRKYILCTDSSYVCMIIFQMSYNYQNEIKTKYIVNHYLGFFSPYFWHFISSYPSALLIEIHGYLVLGNFPSLIEIKFQELVYSFFVSTPLLSLKVKHKRIK